MRVPLINSSITDCVFEVNRETTVEEVNALLKVVVVSGVVNQQEIQGLMDAGASAFVKKPFNIDSLMARIADLLDMNARPGQPPDNSRAGSAA